MSYRMWATSKSGEGLVQDLGQYEEVEQILIQCGMFEDDVTITIEEHADTKCGE